MPGILLEDKEINNRKFYPQKSHNIVGEIKN